VAKPPSFPSGSKAATPRPPKKGRAARTQPPAPQRLRRSAPAYPFAAIVGQEELKLALLLALVEPHIGGVLIMGHRGSGKSTAVRSLADLLPPLVKVKGCFYGCDPEAEGELCDDCLEKRGPRRVQREAGAVPVVDLPLGATEDRVCGTLDIERALSAGVAVFEPGLLAKANRGFLYIDEVNLLEDHLVDVLLDASASGRNIVEREGISISHPARFVLVGSGNPEEGELRPQLLDRFGLFVEIHTIADLDQRVEIVERRERFDRDPFAFNREWDAEQNRLREQITQATAILGGVSIDRAVTRKIAELCVALGVDGHRGELTIARAAKALAALEGRRRVTARDIRRVAPLALRHRLRKDPLQSSESASRIEHAIARIFPDSREGEYSEHGESGARLALIK